MLRHRDAFTLIELLLAIGIIAIISVVVVIALNPSELLKQARDANRVSDLSAMKNAIGIYTQAEAESDAFSMGSPWVTYTSLSDPTATTTAGTDCNNIGPISYSGTFHCAASSTYRKTDGTGWIPVDFSSIPTGDPFGALPVDPTNQIIPTAYWTNTTYAYTYITNGTRFMVTAAPESQKYTAQAETTPGMFTVGNLSYDTPVLIQKCPSAGITHVTGANTISCTPSSSITAGNEIYIWAYGPSATWYSISDTLGNTWIPFYRGSWFGWVADVFLGGPDTITVTTTSTLTDFYMGGAEYSGLALGGGEQAADFSEPSSTGLVSPAITTTQPGELLIGMTVGGSGGSAPSSISPWTLEGATGVGGQNVGWEDMIGPSRGSYQAMFSGAGTNMNTTIMVMKAGNSSN